MKYHRPNAHAQSPIDTQPMIDYAPRSRMLDTFGNMVAGALFLSGVLCLVLVMNLAPDPTRSAVERWLIDGCDTDTDCQNYFGYLCERGVTEACSIDF